MEVTTATTTTTIQITFTKLSLHKIEGLCETIFQTDIRGVFINKDPQPVTFILIRHFVFWQDAAVVAAVGLNIWRKSQSDAVQVVIYVQ